jgi:hypothetical protein
MFNAKKMTIGSLLAIAFAAIFVTVLVSGALVSTKTISSTGVIASANLGVYSDSACTTALTSVSWGTVSPGGSVTKTVYLKNLGNTQVTLSMTKANWNPTTANGPVTITWNQEGAVLAANQVSTATLTLNVASSASGITTFSVDVVISGTG